MLAAGEQRGVTDSDVSFEHNCLSLQTAAAEMESVAAQNARAKDPVYHFILSWPAHEQPADDDIFACGRYALEALNMSGHQYVSAVHRDTDHVHLHVAVNRIHPESFRAVYPDRDYFKLGRAVRELELRFGWGHTAGPFAVFERDGAKVVDWASEDKGSLGKKPARAAQMEAHRSEESLFTYSRGAARSQVLKATVGSRNPTWAGLHRVLSRHGLELRPKGQGFAIYDKRDPSITPIKASDLHESMSRSRLERLLGAYVPPDPQAAEDDDDFDGYSRLREPKRDPDQREERRLARAAARADLRAAYAKYRSAFVARRVDPDIYRRAVSARRLVARQEREAIRASSIAPKARKALYSVIAFELARDLEQLRLDTGRDRQALKDDPTNKRMSYEVWVRQLAATGDAAALAQVRAWAYREQRIAKEAATGDGFTAAPGDGADSLAGQVGGFLRQVDQAGTVHYRQDGHRAGFADHGDWMEMTASSGITPSGDAELAALRMAASKYGSSLVITGSEEFTKRCIELLVQHKINVTLVDPIQAEMLRAYRAKQTDRRGASPRKG